MDNKIEIQANNVYISYPDGSVKVIKITPEIDGLINLVEQSPNCHKLLSLYLELL